MANMRVFDVDGVALARRRARPSTRLTRSRGVTTRPCWMS